MAATFSRGERVARAARDGVAWALGVAAGVALAAWVTASWGTGAPGPGSLDVRFDLFAVPIVSGLAAGVAVFLGSVAVRLIAGARAARPRDDAHDNAEQRDRQDVDRVE